MERKCTYTWTKWRNISCKRLDPVHRDILFIAEVNVKDFSCLLVSSQSLDKASVPVLQTHTNRVKHTSDTGNDWANRYIKLFHWFHLEKASAHHVKREFNPADLSNVGYVCCHWWAAVRFLKFSADALKSDQQLRTLGKDEELARAVELYNRCLTTKHNHNKVIAC